MSMSMSNNLYKSNTSPLPLLLNNYKMILFTEDNKKLKKLILSICIPFSFIVDIFMFIPRYIKKLISSNKLESTYKML